MHSELKPENKILFKIASTPKNQAYFIIFAVLSLAVMVFIFIFSAQSAEQSQSLSDDFGDKLKILLNSLSWLFSEGASDFIYTHIRKIAHFTLYALLGTFVFSALFNTKIKRGLIKLSLAAGICLFYSITDEFHQLCVNGRSGELLDVLIDFSGAVTGIFLTVVFYKIICFSFKKDKKI